MKHTGLDTMGGAAPVVHNPGPGPGGGDDWLSRVQSTIHAFRDAIKMAQELRGIQAELTPGQRQADQEIPLQPLVGPKGLPAAAEIPPPAVNPPAADSQAIVKLLAQYGDTKIGDILKVVSPMTVKQVIELVKNGIRPGK